MIAYPDGPEIVYRPGSDAKEKSKITAKERRRDENIEYENLKPVTASTRGAEIDAGQIQICSIDNELHSNARHVHSS